MINMIFSVVFLVRGMDAVDVYNTYEIAGPSNVWATTSTCQSLGFDYFDSSTLQCAKCGTSLVPKYSSADPRSFMGCQCVTGYYAVYKDCSQDKTGLCSGFSCVSCASSGLASYSDGSACVACDSTTTLGLSADTNECICAPSTPVLVEEDSVGNKLNVKSCGSCPSGTAVIATTTYIAGQLYVGNRYQCQSCPDSLMTLTHSSSTGMFSCTCPSSYTITGDPSIGVQSCVLTAAASTYLLTQTAAATITYTDAHSTVISSVILHYFVSAATKCAFYAGAENIVDCQVLANLCVLQLGDRGSTVCSVYQAIMTSRGSNYVNNVIGWDKSLPWLYYSGAAEDVCKDKRFSARIDLKGYHLQYMVSSYTLNGTWLGMKSLETTFSYCTRNSPYSNLGGGTSGNDAYHTYGSYAKDTYSCQLSTLIGQQQLFYEMFLVDTDTNQLYPVPMRMRYANFRPSFLCDNGDTLMRRFFLFDVVSAVSTATGAGVTTSTVPTLPTPVVVRYAETITLEVSLQSGATPHIYAPVLTIQYGERRPSDWGSNSGDSSVDYTVEGRFTMDMTDFKQNLQGFLIAGIILFVALFGIRYSNWHRRKARIVNGSAVASTVDIFGGFNIRILLEMAVLGAHSWNLIFFPFTVVACWVVFLFFKMQSIPTFMLPPMDSIYDPASFYYLFTTNLYVMAFFQLAYVVVFIVLKQANADVFFVDWEPISEDKPMAESGGPKRVKSGGRVSVWRSILVANQWSKMMTMRRTNIRFTLLFIGCIFYASKLQFDATQSPGVTQNRKDTGVVNVLLRFAIVTFWWMAFSLAQYLWKYLIYERYIYEPVEQLFIDLCTLAKISVLVLDENFHGYYLHCRSPHQFADGSMPELVEMLHREEAGLTVDRSLDGAPAGVQSFEVFMSGIWRSTFDKIYTNAIQAPSVVDMIRLGQRSRKTSSGGGRAGNTGLPGAVNAFFPGTFSANEMSAERVLKAWREVSVFLQEFIENNFSNTGLRRAVRERTYLEAMLRTPPNLTVGDQPCAFIVDRSFDYTEVLFLGCERDLLMLNVLSYALFDLWFESPAASIFVCYLLDALICYLRSSIGKAALTKKALVDERFVL